MSRRSAFASIPILWLALASAQAGEPPPGPGLLVCYPHGPGTSESARPVMERFGAALSAATGDEIAPAFFSEVAPAASYIDAERPRFAILSLPLYLAWRGARGLSLVAATQRDQATTERYHLVVRADAPWQRLDDLKAARGARRPVVWSSHLDDPRFVSNVVFAGALRVQPDDSGHVRGVVTAQPLRALRKMKSGDPFEGQPVDAVLLEDSAWSELQKLATFKGSLRALASSAPLPTPPVVAFAGTDPQATARLTRALTELHASPDGRDLLGTLQLTGFATPDAAAYEAAAKAYAAEAP